MHLRASIWLGLVVAPALFAAPSPVHAGPFEDAVLAELNRVRAHPQAYARELRRGEITPSRYDQGAGQPYGAGEPNGAGDGGWGEDDPEAGYAARAAPNDAPPDGAAPDGWDAGDERRLPPDDQAPGYGGAGASLAANDPEAVEDAIAFLMRQRPLPALAHDGRLAAAAREHAERQSVTGEVGHGPQGSLGQRLQQQGLYAGLEGESISYGQRDPRAVVRQLIIDAGVPNRGHRKDLLSGSFQAAGVACGRHAEWGSMCVIDLAGAIVRR